ncbi:hypothetical protein [Anaeromusa sp.]|uniref:hypothetical protein n=1 Tax=Anaeromusa sp. TaxID=1872520 RepID=UPI0026290A91|nr:hypothetical protein [Anaeromusa sp.]MDD3158021.1 hypothetical protein [Anaeromusa sp.]
MFIEFQGNAFYLKQSKYSKAVKRSLKCKTYLGATVANALKNLEKHLSSEHAEYEKLVQQICSFKEKYAYEVTSKELQKLLARLPECSVEQKVQALKQNLDEEYRLRVVGREL